MAESTLYKTALNKAMALCSRREYCCDDIRNKLISWGVSGSDSEKVIENLIKENFINEKRFATAFVKDKFNYNKWGKIKIAAHLRHRNIAGDIIREALDSIDYDIYTRVLKDLITSHRRSVKSKNQYDLKAKLLRYGLSKGFESSLLYEVLNESED
ncbi:MAG: RecX family transcriptional regulator [Bacteroidales bacterium]|nr:RecX family transcriptional regulator [Bacteroidales bacterium]